MKKQPAFKLSTLSASLLAFSLVNGAWGGVGNHFGLNTHENGVAWGTNAVNQLSHGVASGQGATVTRGNLTREQYQEGVRQYQSLLDEKNQLTAQKAQLEGNKKLKAGEITALNNRINELNNKITEHGNTLGRINSLNQQKQTMVDFVNNINSQITAKEGEYNLSDKTRIYEFEDFYKTLNKLDWTQYGNGAGADNLANQLKARVSEFNPNIANKYGQDKYKEIINAYVNLNSIDKQPTVNWFNERLTTKDMGLGRWFNKNNELTIDESSYSFFDMKYKHNNNNKHNYNGYSLNNNDYEYTIDEYHRGNIDEYAKYNNEKAKNTNDIWKYKDKTISNQYLEELEWMYNNLDNTTNYSLYITRNTLRAVLGKDAPNLKLKNVESKYIIGLDYLTTLYANFGDINLVESLQKVINFSNGDSLGKGRSKFYTTIQLNSINNENINKANELANNFIRDYEGIDLNATAKNVASIEETRNLFKPFYDKMIQLRDITNLYKEINSGTLDESTKQQKQAVYLQKLSDYRNALNAEIDHYDTLEGYIAHFVRPYVRYSDEFVNHFKTATREYIDFLKENRHKLLSYDPNDEFIKEVSDKAKSLLRDLYNLNNQKSAKEKEIEKINSQITALNQQLGPDETALNQQKQEKQAELERAQREKAELDSQVAEKEAELARKQVEVLEKLKQQSGEGNAVAIGDNSFASGVSAVALGVGSESIGDHALALGTQAKATKSDSIAIGHGTEVTGEKSIAIGKGHRVSGNHSTTVGDPNTITGDDSVAVGNNNTINSNHVMVLGNNVTVGENLHHSVVLGSNSTVLAPVATASHTIAGTQYNFAGTAPVATVSIGAEGKERTLTNLAAGRISNTSTDGINGSQLNAVIETLNSLNNELTTLKNTPKTKAPVIKAGDGLSLTEGEDGSITLSNALNFNAGNGVSVNKEGNNITIINTQPLSDENKAKYDNASTKAETAVQPDKLKAGDGISVSKADNGDITITNTKAFETTDKEKLNTASTNANSALEKANTNEGAINTANGKITDLTGKVTTNEGKINDLTSRVTANEGNITTLTGNVNNVSNTANEALGKANTAVQPDALEAGNGIRLDKADGKITIVNTKAFEDADKEKLNTASTNANSALEKANANENAINIANGKITANEGKINDLTSRVKANEGNITTLTDKVATVTNTANEALGKANTAVQPDKLKAGNGISINKAENGDITVTNTHPLSDENKTKYDNASTTADNALEKANNALPKDGLIGGEGISIQPKGDKLEISSTVKGENGNENAPLPLKAGAGISIQDKEGKSEISTNLNGSGIKITQNENGSVTLTNNIEAGSGVELERSGNKIIIKSKPIKQKLIDDAGRTLEKDSIKVTGGKNVTTVVKNGDFAVGLNDDIDVKSVTSDDITVKNKVSVGDNELSKDGLKVATIRINKNGISAGGKVINDVKEGEVSETSQQAINGSQLHQTHQMINQVAMGVGENRQMIQVVNQRVDGLAQHVEKTSKSLRAGVAGSVATASLPQVYASGKSMVSAATGHYKNQNAIAIGYSKASDNGKLVFKVNASANTSKDVTVGTGIGYQW